MDIDEFVIESYDPSDEEMVAEILDAIDLSIKVRLLAVRKLDKSKRASKCLLAWQSDQDGEGIVVSGYQSADGFVVKLF